MPCNYRPHTLQTPGTRFFCRSFQICGGVHYCCGVCTGTRICDGVDDTEAKHCACIRERDEVSIDGSSSVGGPILLLPLPKCARACVRECERSAVKDRVLAAVEDVDVDVLAVALTSIETLTFRHATQSGQQFFHPPEVSESRWTPPPNESRPQITDNFECGVAGGRCKHTHTHTHTSLKCLILDALNSLVRLLLLFCVNQASPVSSRIWPAY